MLALASLVHELVTFMWRLDPPSSLLAHAPAMLWDVPMPRDVPTNALVVMVPPQLLLPPLSSWAASWL